MREVNPWLLIFGGVSLVLVFVFVGRSWLQYKEAMNSSGSNTQTVKEEINQRVEQKKKTGDIEAEVLSWDFVEGKLLCKTEDTNEEKEIVVDVSKMSVIVNLANGHEKPVMRRSVFEKAFCKGDKILIQSEGDSVKRIRNVGPRMCGL